MQRYRSFAAENDRHLQRGPPAGVCRLLTGEQQPGRERDDQMSAPAPDLLMALLLYDDGVCHALLSDFAYRVFKLGRHIGGLHFGDFFALWCQLDTN